MALILVLIYSLIAVAALRPLAGALAYHFMGNSVYRRQDKPNGDQWFCGIFCSLFLAPIWPLVIVYLISGEIDRFTIGPEREHRQAKKIEDQKERIKELERQAGIYA